MKARKLLLYAQLLLLPVIVLQIPASAIICVSKSGNNANDGLSWATSKLTVQAGVTQAAAQADKTVWVAVGTLPPPALPLQPAAIPYVENVVVPANVGVYGGFRGDEAASSPPPARVLSTIVRPSAVATPIFATGTADIVDGFTIENGGADLGAGVLCSGSCILSHDIIRNNSGRQGAGVYSITGALSVADSQFSGNTATNTAGGLAAGASIFVNSNSLFVLRSTFTNETARVTTVDAGISNGGSIYATGTTLVKLDRDVFTRCAANGSTNTVFAAGGAAYIAGTSALITNCVFTGCAARGSGDPFCAQGGSVFYHNPGTISVINNTFVGNAVTPHAGTISQTDRAYGQGGALFLTGTGTSAKVWNNIFAQTRGTAVVNEGMVVSFNYNLLWHNAGGDIFGFSFPVQNPPSSTDKNIMKDPQFLKGDPLFHITFGSPAKNAGSNSGAPGFDIDGEARPFQAVVDIGADEFVDTDLDGGADVNPLETSPLVITGAETDTDGDGVRIPYDNCPTNANLHQVDSNGDGIGDVCEGIPEVFYVDAGVVSSGNGLSWATAFKTIQEGINAADLHNQTNVDGATAWTGVNPQVWIKKGNYNENPLVWHGVQVYGGFNGTELPPSANPNVLSGRTPLTNVSQIIGGALWSTVVIAHLPQDRYLAGITKTTYDSLTPTIDGFLIDNGKAEIGGGVSVYKETVNLSTNRINSNVAALGGGVYLFKSFGTVGDGIGPAPGNLLTGDTTVNSNSAFGPISYAGYGAGVYAEQGGPLLFANIVQGNVAFFGGAVAARKSNPSLVNNLIGCQVAPNSAVGTGANAKGGGVYLDLNSWAAFEENTIVSNTATGAGGQGGGLWLDTSDFVMDLTIMAFNTAAAGQEIWANSPAAQVVLFPLCYITRSDFWPVSATNFFGIADPTVGGPVPCVMTNFAVDPLFVNPLVCNYRLQAASPLRLPNGQYVGAFQDIDPPVSIAQAKELDNGITVEISGAVVAAVFPDGFYIMDADRINGIKVIMQDPAVSEGQIVNVTGVMTTLNDERQIINAQIDALLGAAMSVEPLGMPNATVGGGPVGKWASGVTEGAGLSNLGLLVRTWGKVTERGTSPHAYFVIDDGSGVGVKVQVQSGSSLPVVGDVVSATGISTIEPRVDGKRGRLIRARRASDIIPR